MVLPKKSFQDTYWDQKKIIVILRGGGVVGFWNLVLMIINDPFKPNLHREPQERAMGLAGLEHISLTAHIFDYHQ